MLPHGSIFCRKESKVVQPIKGPCKHCNFLLQYLQGFFIGKNMKKMHLPKKPVYLKLAQDIDYYELFQKIEQIFPTCFLLESLGTESTISRYALIGFDPKTIFKAKGNVFYENKNSRKTENPYKLLQQSIPQDCFSRNYA